MTITVFIKICNIGIYTVYYKLYNNFTNFKLIYYYYIIFCFCVHRPKLSHRRRLGILLISQHLYSLLLYEEQNIIGIPVNNILISR